MRISLILTLAGFALLARESLFPIGHIRAENLRHYGRRGPIYSAN